MADQVFDRVILNASERPLSRDVNRATSQAMRTAFEMVVDALHGQGPWASPPTGTHLVSFFGGGFQPSTSVGLQVGLRPGFGWQVSALAPAGSDLFGVSDLDDLGARRPLVLSVAELFAVPAPPAAPDSRIDIIEVTPARRRVDSEVRDLLNVPLKRFDPTAGVLKTLTYDLAGTSTLNGAGTLNYKTGTPGVAPLPPATTAGYFKVTEIRVNNGDVAIPSSQIKDCRRLAYPGCVIPFSCRVSVDAAGVASVSDVIAPAGVRVLVHGNGASNVVFSMFVFIGGTLLAANASAVVESSAIAPPTVRLTSQNLAALSAAEVAALNNAAQAGAPTLLYIRPGGSGGPERVRFNFQFDAPPVGTLVARVVGQAQPNTTLA